MNLKEVNEEHNLYIVRVSYKDITLIKFGYSSVIKDRLISYYYHNPLIELVGTYYRKDAIEFENSLHNTIDSYIMREWYENSELENIIDYILDKKQLPNRVSSKQVSSKQPTFTEILKTYCELKEKDDRDDYDDSLILSMETKYPDYIKYYNLLGSKKCKALCYRRGDIDMFILNEKSKDEVIKIIVNKLSNGFISSKDLKVILTDAYKKANIQVTAKATDILKCNFIEVRNNKEISKKIDGKVINGFEIIK